MKIETRNLVAALAGLVCASAASAADIAYEPPPETLPPPAKEWTFTIAPYLWAAGLEGDVGLSGRQPVGVDMSFGDIFDNLRFGGMVVSELHNDTWGLFGDLVYVSTVANQSITRTVNDAPATLSARVETHSFTGTLMGEYRALSTERATIDVMAGGRIWNVDNDISVSLASDGSEVADFSGGDSATWVDPMIGAKMRINTNSPWYFTAWGMIGGFGAGADLDWDLLAGVGYQWNERFAMVGGYRALGVDYEDDGFVYDIVQQGPFLGAVVKF